METKSIGTYFLIAVASNRQKTLVSILAMGEGWHNYHHTFPWDYKVAELPHFINLTTVLLDIFAKIGWAYDAKVASPTLIRATVLRKNK